MKIDVTINEKLFSEIEAGETFYYEPSETMWIKLNGQLFDKTKATLNVVCLNNGIAAYFEDTEMVTVVPTKLVNA